MGKKGLCDTCDHDKSCIFQNGIAVLQCEEFSSGNNVLKTFRQPGAHRRVVSEVATESE